jgi:hypothetical protein
LAQRELKNGKPLIEDMRFKDKISRVAIDEQEITFPGLILFGLSDAQDVRRKTETSNAAITFIENLHPFLQVP